MALDFDGPASIVLDAYERSLEFANEAKQELSEFTESLNESIYSAPTIAVNWSALAAPDIPDMLEVPSLQNIEFDPIGSAPAAFVGDIGDTTIDDFTVPMPVLNFGVAPTISYGEIPGLPTVNDVTVPTAPVLDEVTLPSYLTIGTPTFGGINLHEDWLENLKNIPEFDLLAPTPMQYTRGAAYASALLSNIQAVLNQRIQGGSGLTPAVEQALWDRGRDRETQNSLAARAEVMRRSETLGFVLPSGVTAAQYDAVDREYRNKNSSLSRDIMTKMADLEQENMKQTITAGIQLESQLMDYAFKMEQLAFEAAKTVAENAIAVYNAGIELFRALLQGYTAYANTYDTLIKSELTKVEVYKAQLQAEQTKADINRTMVEQYKAMIDASMARVEIFKAQVSAAEVLVSLEQTKLQVGVEQVKAFVATVNAETSKVEAYKASVGAETAKVEAYGSLTRAYASKASAQAERARVAIAKYSAEVTAKGQEWDGYRARIAAESARVDAVAKQGSIVFEGYKLAATAITEKARLTGTIWDSNMKQYDAGYKIALEVARANQEAVMHAKDARADIAKTGASVYAQLAASAYNIVSTSAQISGSAQLTQVVNS